MNVYVVDLDSQPIRAIIKARECKLNSRFVSCNQFDILAVTGKAQISPSTPKEKIGQTVWSVAERFEGLRPHSSK